MKVKLYAIRDDKASLYNPPVIMQNDAIAVRTFGDLVARDDSVIGSHPEDYTLRVIGEFDNETGELHQDVYGNILATGSDFKVKETK